MPASTSPALPAVGAVGWMDLAVGDAEGVRAFYEAVVGWGATPLDVGGHADHVMTRPDTSEAVAGVCHARGPSAGLPAQWLTYVVVADLAASVAACTARGGRVLSAPRRGGPGLTYGVLQDPAGAAFAVSEHRTPGGA